MGNSQAPMAAAATVQNTMEIPADTVCRKGTQANRQLKVSASSTTYSTERSYLAGGTTMAMNMP